MDEMKLESKPIRGLASKAIRLFIRKKTGYDVEVNLGEFRTTVIDGKAHVHLNVDFELNKDELDKLIKSISL